VDAPHRTRAFARDLRQELTLPEVLLWVRLRRCGLGGLKFRRQHPVGPFILDFYCASAKLAVEVDGATHAEQGQGDYDAERDAWLARYGVRSLRIPASEVLGNLDGVMETILFAAGGGCRVKL